MAQSGSDNAGGSPPLFGRGPLPTFDSCWTSVARIDAPVASVDLVKKEEINTFVVFAYCGTKLAGMDALVASVDLAKKIIRNKNLKEIMGP